jgi:hypothetical protein
MIRLIDDNNKLNMDVFKDLFFSIKWTKLPRVLGPNHTDYFYTGVLEDAERRIAITVRPTQIMAVSENLKGRHPQNGAVPDENYKGMLVEWGYYVEVKVPDSFMKDLDEWSQVPIANAAQVLEW